MTGEYGPQFERSRASSSQLVSHSGLFDVGPSSLDFRRYRPTLAPFLSNLTEVGQIVVDIAPASADFAKRWTVALRPFDANFTLVRHNWLKYPKWPRRLEIAGTSCRTTKQCTLHRLSSESALGSALRCLKRRFLAQTLQDSLHLALMVLGRFRFSGSDGARASLGGQTCWMWARQRDGVSELVLSRPPLYLRRVLEALHSLWPTFGHSARSGDTLPTRPRQTSRAGAGNSC